MSCTCKDETQTKTLTCGQCKKEWSQPLASHERVSECPEHHHMIAICFPHRAPAPLCSDCAKTF